MIVQWSLWWRLKSQRALLKIYERAFWNKIAKGSFLNFQINALCCLRRVPCWQFVLARFFNFGGPGKKKANQPQALLQQQQSTAASLSQQVPQVRRSHGLAIRVTLIANHVLLSRHVSTVKLSSYNLSFSSSILRLRILLGELYVSQALNVNVCPQGSLAGRRRGSDRSLSGSAHELAVSGVRDKELSRAVSHSHSQSNLSDIPYRSVQTGNPTSYQTKW